MERLEFVKAHVNNQLTNYEVESWLQNEITTLRKDNDSLKDWAVKVKAFAVDLSNINTTAKVMIAAGVSNW